MRRYLVRTAMMLSLVLCASHAATAQQVPAEGVAQVLTNQLGPMTRASPRGKLEPVTVYFREGAVRVDFRDASGASFQLLLPGEGQPGWFVGAKGAAMPAPNAKWPLVFDPLAPCAGQGMFASCQGQGQGLVAGQNARHWRYRFSRNSGPGMTSRGDMWLDAETGLVLSYRGETGVGLAQEWRVQSVTYGPLPEDTFELPASIRSGQ